MPKIQKITLDVRLMDIDYNQHIAEIPFMDIKFQAIGNKDFLDELVYLLKKYSNLPTDNF